MAIQAVSMSFVCMQPTGGEDIDTVKGVWVCLLSACLPAIQLQTLNSSKITASGQKIYYILTVKNYHRESMGKVKKVKLN